jgi:hypothetical protein
MLQLCTVAAMIVADVHVRMFVHRRYSVLDQDTFNNHVRAKHPAPIVTARGEPSKVIHGLDPKIY